MKIGAIVQARMSSERFPGKVLYEVGGKPLLQYLLERLERCTCLDTIVVATSVEASDNPIAEYCQQHGINHYRGHMTDVANRFKEASVKYRLDAFVRVNGDSPLLDQRLIEKGVSLFLGGDFDLVTNVMPRTYPRGQSVEVLRAATYRSAYARMKATEELEHITQYFYRHPEDFRIRNFSLKEDLSQVQLCVDTREDLDTFKTIVSRMDRPHWEYHLEDIIRIYHSLA